MIPYDKALHILVGVCLFAVFHFFFGWQIGIIAAVVVGALKEVYDRVSGRGTPDIRDFFATVAGGILGFLCTLTR